MIVRHIVEPNGLGGEYGPPIECGVHSRVKNVPGGSIREEWSDPWPAADDLPDALLVRSRTRTSRGVTVAEIFDPPVPEAQLPVEVQPEAVKGRKETSSVASSQKDYASGQMYTQKGRL